MSTILPHMVGWIKMKLDMEIGLRPGHTVLNGQPSPQKINKGAQSSM